MSPLLSTFAGAGVRPFGWGGNTVQPAFELISTQVLASTASSVTFSSIPTTYKNLQIRLVMANSAAFNDLAFQFNGDTGSNYSWHLLTGNGTSVSSSAGTSQASIRSAGHVTGQGASTWLPAIIDVLDASSTSKYKTARILGGVPYSGNYDVSLTSGLWLNTAAVSSVTLFNSGSGTYSVGSRFSLYGVRG